MLITGANMQSSKQLLVLALGLLVSTIAVAGPAARVTQASGVVTVQRSGGVQVLGVNSTVNSGETLATGNNAYVRLKFADGGDLTLRPNTQLQVTQFNYDERKPAEDNAVFSLLKGGLRAITGLVGKRGNTDSYQMRTSSATIGIRGTNYGALVCDGDCSGYRDNAGNVPPNGLHVDVAEGRIIVTNTNGVQELGAGQFGVVLPGLGPQLVPTGKGLTVGGGAENNPSQNFGQTLGAEQECFVE